MTEQLDGEFEYLNGVAARVVSVLSDHDKKLARRWLTKIATYQSKNLEVARSRNDLMRNLLGVLRKTLFFRVMSSKKAQHMIKGDDLKQLHKEISSFGEPGAETRVLDMVYSQEKAQLSFMSLWSADKRTYIAAKPIGGEGALIYVAVTPHPELGWDLPDPTSSGLYKFPTDDCEP